MRHSRATSFWVHPNLGSEMEWMDQRTKDVSEQAETNVEKNMENEVKKNQETNPMGLHFLHGDVDFNISKHLPPLRSLSTFFISQFLLLILRF